jgi:XRE family transcriptional regulator, regulator of sulfur utilization
MNQTRRDFAWLIPALTAVSARAADVKKLPSHSYKFEDLPARQNGQNVRRQIFDGALRQGFHIEAHETELGPMQEPHPPHRHVHEEILVVIEGSVEYTVGGVTTRLGPGGAAFVASNDEHHVKNHSATARSRHVVVEFRGD